VARFAQKVPRFEKKAALFEKKEATFAKKVARFEQEQRCVGSKRLCYSRLLRFVAVNDDA
jgi:hypothetical protein